ADGRRLGAVVRVAHVVHDPPERLVPDDVGAVTAGEVVVVGVPVPVDDGGAEGGGPVAEVRELVDGGPGRNVGDVGPADLEDAVVGRAVAGGDGPGRGRIERAGPELEVRVGGAGHAELAADAAADPDAGG